MDTAITKELLTKEWSRTNCVTDKLSIELNGVLTCNVSFADTEGPMWLFPSAYKAGCSQYLTIFVWIACHVNPRLKQKFMIPG